MGSGLAESAARVNEDLVGDLIVDFSHVNVQVCVWVGDRDRFVNGDVALGFGRTV